jgi:hypothetical protein
VPVHVAAQISLNKLTLKKLTSAVERDPAEDLTVILADLSKLYPPKRKTATEKRPPIRRGKFAQPIRVSVVYDSHFQLASRRMAQDI